ncbi:vomeronasal 1 receptor ornAnaV1R3164 [Ornithorhynchus anatinus]|uniref:Vomeronasal type-1 receptor n=1 Tax=Ornithorhynchus anatinus TaxID=9258 RepID=F6U8Y2_ORNAN|nr:vomeronasal 1 receptor ornAnaV1R3164 [Ornithorhynchus anatinus]
MNVVAIFFLFQTGIGLLGNSALLMVYVNVFINQPNQIKPADLILTHLTMANAVTLLTQAAPWMVMAFRWENNLDIVACQIALYMRRVARGLSICTMCLLSVFQAITISPSTSCWAQFKPRARNCIVPSFLFFWILNLTLDGNILKTIAPSINVTTVVNSYNSKCCGSILRANYLNNVVFQSAMTFRDLFFVFLMSWSSGYMVMVLHQHHKQVQHIHSTSLSPKSSPETRATQTILLLVTCFVCFYCINFSINFSLNFVEDVLRLYDPATFLGACYAFLCPLVMIRNESRVPRSPWILKMLRRLFPRLELRDTERVTSLSNFLPMAPL